MTIREAEVRIIGKDYEYVAYDGTGAQTGLLTRAVANRKHGCRFIVNDNVKYAQEKSKLYVLDADGKSASWTFSGRAASPQNPSHQVTRKPS